MDFIIIIILGILPSFIWLLFFLRRDAHPEPKSMILKVFFAGALVAPAAAVAGTGFQEILLALNFSPASTIFLLSHIFFGVALIEEILKYIVVKFLVLPHYEFDEPVDALLYMIISGLGFAALENILVFLAQTILGQTFGDVLSLIVFRFLTATFLHALCSAIIGYFLALSICDSKKKIRLISIGLGLGIFFHGLYDLAVIKISDNLIERGGEVLILDKTMFIFWSVTLFAIIVGLAIFITQGFRRLKKIKSVCLPDFVFDKIKKGR